MKNVLVFGLFLQFFTLASFADDQRVLLNPQGFKTEVLKELGELKTLVSEVETRLKSVEHWDDLPAVRGMADSICDVQSAQSEAVGDFTARMSLVNDAWLIKMANEENATKAQYKKFYTFDSVEKLFQVEQLMRLMWGGFCMEMRDEPSAMDWNQAEVGFLDGEELTEYQGKIKARLEWWENHLNKLNVASEAEVDLTDAFIYMDVNYEALAPLVKTGTAKIEL